MITEIFSGLFHFLFHTLNLKKCILYGFPAFVKTELLILKWQLALWIE